MKVHEVFARNYCETLETLTVRRETAGF